MRKVTALGKSGWEIQKRDNDKVIMSKDKKEMFVYTTGQTFSINESKEESDVSDLIEALVDEDADEQLDESFISNAINKMRGKPKITIYSNGRDGVISIAELNNNLSLYHSVKGNIIHESSAISSDAIADYIETHKEKGYRKVTNRADLIRISSMVLGTAALALGAGVVAGIGVRMIISLIAMREEARAATVVGDSAEQIKELKDQLMTHIDNTMSRANGAIVIDMDSMQDQLETSSSRYSLLGMMGSLGGWSTSRVPSISWEGIKTAVGVAVGGGRGFVTKGFGG
jgi:hypothetical protein